MYLSSRKVSAMSFKRLKILWIKNSMFQSRWLTKFINGLTRNGNKAFIERMYEKAFIKLKTITKAPHLLIFDVLCMIKPIFLMRWIRKAKHYFSIPKMASTSKQYRFAIYMFSKLILTRRSKKNYKIPDMVIDAIMSVYVRKNSELVDFKNDMYNTAVFNRSKVRFKW